MRLVTDKELIAMGRSPQLIFPRMSTVKEEPWITGKVLRSRFTALLNEFLAPDVLNFRIDERRVEEIVIVGIAEGGLYAQFTIADFFENKLNKALASRRIIRTSSMTLRVRSAHSGLNHDQPSLSSLPTDLSQIEGKLVLLVDDIADTGATLKAVTAKLEEYEPARILSIVCLCKPWAEFKPDYVAFRIPNQMIAVGWGMDAGMGVGRANHAIWNIASYLRRMKCTHLISEKLISWAEQIGNQDLLELAIETKALPFDYPIK